jgi:Uma2 family endonuclease
MTPAVTSTPHELTVDLKTVKRVLLRPCPDFTDDDFFDFCQRHDKLLRIERNAEGEIIVMVPLGTEGGGIEFDVAGELRDWARRDGRGRGFGPNAGITLPDGSTFSPDVFWVPSQLWRAVPRSQRRKFAPLVPSFVIEIRSASDRVKDLHDKMLAYLRNGVELGWFIDPICRKVRIYRQGEPFIELDNPASVEGAGPVAGFVLDLKEIYDELDR